LHYKDAQRKHAVIPNAARCVRINWVIIFNTHRLDGEKEESPTMSDPIARALLWLFVIFLGITFGAGIYEARIVVPHWLGSSEDSGRHWNADAARRDDTGRRFWAFVTTLPLTLLTLASLIVAWRAPDPLRSWWLAAATLAVADRIFTFSYFIPTMVRLMRAADSSESVMKAITWANLNYVRLAIVLAAWLASLKVFSLLYQNHI
jgi:hypothetical protein